MRKAKKLRFKVLAPVAPESRHPGGRPTKRTPEITARIAEAISFGITNEEAAAIVGIDDDTLTEWNKIPEFSGAIKSAVAIRKLSRLKRIEAGESGWQGTAWALERQYPERFARPEIQLSLGRSPANSNLAIWLQTAPNGKGALALPPCVPPDGEDPFGIEDLDIVCDAEQSYHASNGKGIH